ncbi:MAG: hypothetical protein MUF31_11740 [Akkermansiaceae bacterium]|nr:hypothetical protein [Akkermansiaceae bacterium]
MNSPIPKPEPPPRRQALPGPPSAADPTFYLPKVELPRLLGVIRRRAWIPLTLAIIAAAAAWVILGRMPKYYVSSGSVYVSTGVARLVDVETVAVEESKDLEQLLSVEQGMRSNLVLERVIARLKLQEDPTFAPGATTPLQVLETLADRLVVELRRGTRLIDITVEDTDPARARLIVEVVKEEYESLGLERQDALLEDMSRGLAEEEARLRGKMESDAAEVERFREENPVPGLGAADGVVAARETLGLLTNRLNEAKAARIELEAEREAFARFEPEDPNALAGLRQGGPTAEVTTLIQSIREKELEFAAIKERYLEKHPKHIEATRELESLRKSLDAALVTAGEAIEKSYRIALDNEEKLAAEVALASTRAADNEGLRARFADLERRATESRGLHEQVAQRLRETHLAGAVTPSALSWRDAPLAPENPSRPRKILLAPVAGALAMGLGILIAGALELTDRRIRGVASVMRATGAPMLGRLPAGGENAGLVVMSSPGSAVAEAFRRLRAILSPPGPSGAMQTILFTSSKRGEGASFCAVNHAVSLAMEGHRTLLIDADLRSPGISRDHLRERAGHLGLGGYLEGQATAADACVRTAVPRLYLISSGELRGDAADLLSRTRFPALLDEAGNWFDRVVIDAPALLETSDAQVVSRYANRTCLVVGPGGADRAELREAANMIRSAGGNLAGFVWNERPAGRGPAPSLTVAREALGDTPRSGLSLKSETSMD